MCESWQKFKKYEKIDGKSFTDANTVRNVKDATWSVARDGCLLKEAKVAMVKKMLLLSSCSSDHNWFQQNGC